MVKTNPPNNKCLKVNLISCSNQWTASHMLTLSIHNLMLHHLSLISSITTSSTIASMMRWIRIWSSKKIMMRVDKSRKKKVTNHFVQLTYFLRRLVNELVVQFRAVDGFHGIRASRFTRPFNVPHVHRRIIWRDEGFTISALRDWVYMKLVDVCEGVFQLNWVLS